MFTLLIEHVNTGQQLCSIVVQPIHIQRHGEVTLYSRLTSKA